MGLEVTVAKESDRGLWNSQIATSSHGTIFHTWDWLKVVERHTQSKLYPFIFNKEERIVALYPIFITKKSFVNLAFSPPSHAYLLYLGPIFPELETYKQWKKENTITEIQSAMDTILFSDFKCKYARIRTSPGFFDSRPFRWAGYKVYPYYTYRIPLSKGFAAVNSQFHHKAKHNINKMIRDGVTVRWGDLADINFILDALEERYIAQGLPHFDHTKYLQDLYRLFYPEHLKVLIAEYEGERVGGTIYLCFKKIVYFWVGAAKSSIKGMYPNDLVQNEAIKWACSNDYLFFEEMEAGDDQRLTHFKAKFNPDLVIWYSAVKHSSTISTVLEKLTKPLSRFYPSS